MHIVMAHNYPPGKNVQYEAQSDRRQRESDLANRSYAAHHSRSLAGHDAFSSFVDVAVQQPQLPVPSPKDDKIHSSTTPVSISSTTLSPQRGTATAISITSDAANARYHINASSTHPHPHHHHHQQQQQLQQPSSAATGGVVVVQQPSLQHNHQSMSAVPAGSGLAQQTPQQYRQQHSITSGNGAGSVAIVADMQRRMDQAKRDQRLHHSTVSMERDRDIQQKRQERERIERIHVERLDREREQRERDRDRDRDRERDRERERERREQERAVEERERDNRRIERLYSSNASSVSATGSSTGPSGLNSSHSMGQQQHYSRTSQAESSQRSLPPPERDRDMYVITKYLLSYYLLYTLN